MQGAEELSGELIQPSIAPTQEVRFAGRGQVAQRMGQGERASLPEAPSRAAYTGRHRGAGEGVNEGHETLGRTGDAKDNWSRTTRNRDATYARLVSISVSHPNNLRHSRQYRDCLMSHSEVRVAIGERRRSQPGCRPECLRAVAVHRGDQSYLTITRCPEYRGVASVQAS